jgi:hypothetical protein
VDSPETSVGRRAISPFQMVKLSPSSGWNCPAGLEAGPGVGLGAVESPRVADVGSYLLGDVECVENALFRHQPDRADRQQVVFVLDACAFEDERAVLKGKRRAEHLLHALVVGLAVLLREGVSDRGDGRSENDQGVDRCCS